MAAAGGEACSQPAASNSVSAEDSLSTGLPGAPACLHIERVCARILFKKKIVAGIGGVSVQFSWWLKS